MTTFIDSIIVAYVDAQTAEPKTDQILGAFTEDEAKAQVLAFFPDTEAALVFRRVTVEEVSGTVVGGAVVLAPVKKTPPGKTK